MTEVAWKIIFHNFLYFFNKFKVNDYADTDLLGFEVNPDYNFEDTTDN